MKVRVILINKEISDKTISLHGELWKNKVEQICQQVDEWYKEF